MPRIAHVISSPSGIGGAERMVSSLARGALDRGWEALVVNPFARDLDCSVLARLCWPAAYRSHHCTSLREVPATREWLRRTLHDFGPELIHSHLFHASVSVASVRLPPGSRTVVTHHHGDYFSYRGQPLSAKLDRAAGLRFEKVVAISSYVRRFLLDSYRYPDRKVELIRNGWQGQPLAHRGGGERPTAICVASFRPEKGHDVLLAAFRQVLHELPAAKLILVGGGELRESLIREITHYGFEDAVELPGEVEDVWPHLAESDVLVAPSRYESLGIAPMEAMAAGLPVVAARVGGIPELVRDGENGLLLRAGNSKALAEALLALLQDPATRTRMGEAGRRESAGMRAEQTLTRYFNLYDALLDRRSVARRP